MKEKITIRSVNQIEPRQRMIEVYDTELIGFYHRVSPLATRPFMCDTAYPIGQGKSIELVEQEN